MKESDCNSEVVRSLQKIGWSAYKIPDVLGSRFTANKPCDILACSLGGRFVAIESKLIKKWQSVSIKILRDHQEVFLTNTCRKRKGQAYLFLFLKIPKTKTRKAFQGLVVFDWLRYGEYIKRQPITIKQLQNQSIGEWFEPYKNKYENNKITWDFRLAF